MSDIFISHVEEDSLIAMGIAIELERVGYTTWTYEVDSMPGPSYLVQTGEAVGASKVVVVVISPHSLSSRQVTNEVIRAHESGKEFVPVLHEITHVEFQNRQPEWREALGAAASIRIPREGVSAILPRILDGLKILSILPESAADQARILQMKSVLNELGNPSSTEKTEAMSESPRVDESESIMVERPSSDTGEKAGIRKKWNKATKIASGILMVVILGSLIAGFFLRQSEDNINNPETPGDIPTSPILGESINASATPIPTEPGDNITLQTPKTESPKPIVLFTENFETGNLKNWDIYNVNGQARIRSQDDNHFLECKNITFCANGETEWEDYILKAKVLLVNGSAAVNFRHQQYTTDRGDVRISYFLLLSKDKTSLRKSRILAGVTGKSTELTTVPFQIKPRAWHMLIIRCQKGKIFLSINGEKVLSYEDTQNPILSGSFGIGSANQTHILYDDIRVEQIQQR